MPRKTPAPKPRRRRDPETARAEILDAAEKVFAAHPPDAIGLKEIGKAAGVSHALVSHYFGTYTDLIDAALERRIRVHREAALAKLHDHAATVSSAELIDALFTMLADPVYIRLSLSALAGERPSGTAPFPLRAQGMRLFAEALAERLLREQPGLERGPLLERLELGLVATNAAAYGYVIGRKAWMAALGKAPSEAFDHRFRAALDAMVRGFVIGAPTGGSPGPRRKKIPAAGARR